MIYFYETKLKLNVKLYFDLTFNLKCRINETNFLLLYNLFYEIINVVSENFGSEIFGFRRSFYNVFFPKSETANFCFSDLNIEFSDFFGFFFSIMINIHLIHKYNSNYLFKFIKYL